MIRVGLIGLDSTHAVEFTRLLNAHDSKSNVRVVAACAGLKTDFPLSVSRRAGIERQLREELAIPMVATTAALLERVDAVMLLTCDARSHAPEIVPLLTARKPLFIDKPLSADWREAARMLSSARATGTPCFSASALRYRPGIEIAKILTHHRPAKLDGWVPKLSEPGHPDLSWHGIHGVEAAYALLGAGCRSVQRTLTDESDVTVGTWSDGSEVCLRRVTDVAANEFPMTINSTAGAKRLCGHNYQNLLDVMGRFFATGNPPIAPREMIEVLAFIAAADASKDAGGAAIDLSDLLASAGAGSVGRVAISRSTS